MAIALRYLLLLPLVCSLSPVIGCSEPQACDAMVHPVTAFVANRSGQPLSMLTVTDTLRRTGAVFQVVAPSSETLLPDSTRVAPIFPDTLSEVLDEPFGDNVIVVVTAESRSTSAVYRLIHDVCSSVRRVAGPDTLVLR
jgi:hypothetical protein